MKTNHARRPAGACLDGMNEEVGVDSVLVSSVGCDMAGCLRRGGGEERRAPLPRFDAVRDREGAARRRTGLTGVCVGRPVAEQCSTHAPRHRLIGTRPHALHAPVPAHEHEVPARELSARASRMDACSAGFVRTAARSHMLTHSRGPNEAEAARIQTMACCSGGPSRPLAIRRSSAAAGCRTILGTGPLVGGIPRDFF